jgi:butyryl-CoA dehydrogenase
MNLTEPQAGSDLAAVRTKAIPQTGWNGNRIYGSKIFITYGEHDYTDNTCASRARGARPTHRRGLKGISLFVVPKFLVDPDGKPRRRANRRPLRCRSSTSLGIHASPTAVLRSATAAAPSAISSAERTAELRIAMFVMMNFARFGVGIQGVGQSRPRVSASCRLRTRSVCRVDAVGIGRRSAGPTASIGHPDVRRMLMTMRADTEAARALGYVTAAALDRATAIPIATCASASSRSPS